MASYFIVSNTEVDFMGSAYPTWKRVSRIFSADRDFSMFVESFRVRFPGVPSEACWA
jgi:hypothetical protein